MLRHNSTKVFLIVRDIHCEMNHSIRQGRNPRPQSLREDCVIILRKANNERSASAWQQLTKYASF